MEHIHLLVSTSDTSNVSVAHNLRTPGRKKYRLARKTDDPFLDGHDKLHHHAKFGEDHTTRAGCRCENVLFFFGFYRQDAAKRHTVDIALTLRPKFMFFRHAGATRCTNSGQTLHDRRAPGPSWLCKISRQSVQMGGNAAPKM